MKTNALKLSIAASVLILVSCKSSQQKVGDSMKPHLLVEGIALNLQEQQKFTRLAEAGDSSAATRLAHHFLLVVYDREKARYWLRQAAIHGGEREKGSYESFMEGYKR